MNIHEYQARAIFRKAGMPVPEDRAVETPDAAAEAAKGFGGPVVVKAQVHAGGRGRAGGVKLAKDPEEARAKAEAILGMTIKDWTVKKVLVAPAVDIDREFYVGIVNDRETRRPVVMVSAAGGVDIEEVAATTPEKIVRVPVDPLAGLDDHAARRLAFSLLKDVKEVRAVAKVLRSLYRVYVDNDCTLAEVNPLIRTPSGEILAIDAKVNLDDNAAYRHPEWEDLRDPQAENPDEIRAKEAGLSFVALDGSIGCLVNGAGLAMATMDAVKHAGGEPANFLDVGGSSNPDKVVTALSIITSNPKVKGILFNIFGGITRCDDIAQGILTALERNPIDLPIVVRLTGTNEEKARGMLEGTKLIPAGTMDEAVDKVVAAAA